MSKHTPRPNIPYEWGEQARCPACSAPDLAVQRQPGEADQLRCTACGLRFELTGDGPYLRVTHWPDLRRPDPLPPPGGWVTPDELRRLLKPRFVSTDPAPAGPQAAVPAAEDLQARAQKLVELGSTPMQVRASLANAGVAPEQVEATLQAAGQAARRATTRQERKLWAWLALVAALLVLGVWGGLRLAAMREPLMNALRSTLAPDLARAAGMTTPIVRQLPVPDEAEAATPVPCPVTPEGAAALFGGDSQSWSKGSNGWIRIDAGGADVIIYVPYGMVAAYFRVGEQLTLVEVPGPATLSQTPGLAISCP